MPYDETLTAFSNEWEIWCLVDPLTIVEAARLLAGGSPVRETNRVLAEKAGGLETAMLRAVQVGRLTPFRALAWYAGFQNEPEPCETSDPMICAMTQVRRSELVRWADENGIEHGWKPEESAMSIATAADYSRFPEELRTAIEAFDAVKNDPYATKGKHPKGALNDWLKHNRPLLSENARERIATVANWQPTGGAPKTPG